MPTPNNAFGSTVENVSGSGVGALRKHAGGMFLASDLGGYAAVASILASAALSKKGHGLPRQCEHWLAMTDQIDVLCESRPDDLPIRRQHRHTGFVQRTLHRGA